MHALIARSGATIALIALAACSSGGSVVPPTSALNNAASTAASTALGLNAALTPANGYIPFMSANPVRRLCSKPMGIHAIRCFALMRTDIPPTLAIHPAAASTYGYSPAKLQAAYGLPSKTAGKGQTVAVVESYGYTALESDLAVYRSNYGLPACTSANGCLKIVNQEGKTSPLPPNPPSSDDWRGEQALDVDMVSAICPNCHILVVQVENENYLYGVRGNGQSKPNGINTAAMLGAQVISNSYGGAEYERSDSTFPASGHIYVASAGDEGGNNCGVPSDCQSLGYAPAAAQQPASLPNFVAVGGTQLVQNKTGRRWGETVWNTLTDNGCSGNCGATSSGCSKLVAKPSWQTDKGCAKRSESDVSADASVNTPVAIYSSPIGGWYAFGGTSASGPIIAAAFALAGNATKLDAAQSIWQHGGSASLYDVTTGNNILAGQDNCFSTVTYICHARKGYDGPTGWGTPHGVGAL